MKQQITKIGLLWAGLTVAVLGANPAQAQSFGGAFNREDVALTPATGNWWSPDTGPGRWGLQIEVQTGSFFPLGFLGAAIFTYSSDDPTIPTWYSISQPYQYNPNWRSDGYIGEMELVLNQSTNGICLRCADGSASGGPLIPDVGSARLRFLDSMNAELTVGNVVHPIIKSHWGDGVEGHLDEIWGRRARFNIEATFLDTRINGAGVIAPVRQAQQVTYEGVGGWDVFNFSLIVVAETISTGRQIDVIQNFQLLSNKENNQYRLVYPGLTANPRLDLKLFPYDRSIVEGRLIDTTGFPANTTQSANALLVTIPSMQPRGTQERPWY